MTASIKFTHPFRPCEGPSTYQEEYRPLNYKPSFVETELGPQIVAPDTPYVGAAGRSRLYFIDTRFDPATAQLIKEQVWLLGVPEKDSRINVDDITPAAEVYNTVTGQSIPFDPFFAKIFFARIMNRCNPSLNLPVPELGRPVGDWLVTYDENGVQVPPDQVEWCSNCEN